MARAASARCVAACNDQLQHFRFSRLFALLASGIVVLETSGQNARRSFMVRPAVCLGAAIELTR